MILDNLLLLQKLRNMKLKLIPLLFSLCLAMLPAVLHADNKNVNETDAIAPISINKGDTLTFSLKDAAWNFVSLASTFRDASIPTTDPNAVLLAWSSIGTNATPTGSSYSAVFNAVNSGQMILLFTKTGTDPVFKYASAITFIVNINDPTATK